MKAKLFDKYLEETNLLSGKGRAISFGNWIDEKLANAELYEESDLNFEVDFKQPIRSFEDTIQASEKIFIAKINYRKLKTKYEVLGWEEVDAHPISIDGFEKLDLFTVKSKEHGVQVIEGRSGIELAPKDFGIYQSKGEAIAETKKRFDSHGLKNLEYHFMLHVREFGLSPRYRWLT